MKSARARGLLLVLMLLFIIPLDIRASGTVGIYAVLTRVSFEPNEAAAERIQIWGAFAYVNGGIQTPSSTSEPQRGSMYFRIPANASEAQRVAIRKEWADLKAVSATPQAVAFGAWGYIGTFTPKMNNLSVFGIAPSSADNGDPRVIKDSEVKGAPAAYRTDSGLVKLSATGSHAAVVAQLRSLLTR